MGKLWCWLFKIVNLTWDQKLVSDIVYNNAGIIVVRNQSRLLLNQQQNKLNSMSHPFYFFPLTCCWIVVFSIPGLDFVDCNPQLNKNVKYSMTLVFVMQLSRHKHAHWQKHGGSCVLWCVVRFLNVFLNRTWDRDACARTTFRVASTGRTEGPVALASLLGPGLLGC